MSEKKFEPCTLEEATHVEMGGKVHLLVGNKVGLQPYRGVWRGILWRKENVFFPEDSFPTLGIKPLREAKREPIEFEAVVKQERLPFSYLGNVPDGIPLGTKFKCVQILEEKK